jgi:hypothetical protein
VKVAKFELEVESSDAISGTIGLGGGSAILKWICMPKHDISTSEERHNLLVMSKKKCTMLLILLILQVSIMQSLRYSTDT